MDDALPDDAFGPIVKMEFLVAEKHIEMMAANIINADSDARLPDGRPKPLLDFFVRVHIRRCTEHLDGTAFHILKLRVPYPLPTVLAGRRTAANHCFRLFLPCLDAAMQIKKQIRVVRVNESPLQHLVRIVVDGKFLHPLMGHGDFPGATCFRVVSPCLQAGMGQRRLHHHLALMQSLMRLHKGIVVVERAVINLAIPMRFRQTHAKIHPSVLPAAVQQPENALEIPLLHKVLLDFLQYLRQIVGMDELHELLAFRPALFLVHAQHIVIPLVQVSAFQHAVLENINAYARGDVIDQPRETLLLLLSLAKLRDAAFIVDQDGRQYCHKHQDKGNHCHFDSA